jgi:hypothetical protein
LAGRDSGSQTGASNHALRKADALRERLCDNISKQREPELADVYVVRSADDIAGRCRLTQLRFCDPRFSEKKVQLVTQQIDLGSILNSVFVFLTMQTENCRRFV